MGLLTVGFFNKEMLITYAADLSFRHVHGISRLVQASEGLQHFYDISGYDYEMEQAFRSIPLAWREGELAD